MIIEMNESSPIKLIEAKLIATDESFHRLALAL
jgi:hypothetical protein